MTVNSKNRRQLTRESDMQVLMWIQMRIDGFSPKEIAEIDGVSTMTVRVATNKVRFFDIAFSGDHAADAYWDA